MYIWKTENSSHESTLQNRGYEFTFAGYRSWSQQWILLPKKPIESQDDLASSSCNFCFIIGPAHWMAFLILRSVHPSQSLFHFPFSGKALRNTLYQCVFLITCNISQIDILGKEMITIQQYVLNICCDPIIETQTLYVYFE